MSFFSKVIHVASGGLIGSSKAKASTVSLPVNETSFANADTDSNGYLSNTDFNSFLNTNISLGSDKVSQIFKDLDTDKDKKLSRDEFLVLKDKKISVVAGKAQTGFFSKMFAKIF